MRKTTIQTAIGPIGSGESIHVTARTHPAFGNAPTIRNRAGMRFTDRQVTAVAVRDAPRAEINERLARGEWCADFAGAAEIIADDHLVVFTAEERAKRLAANPTATEPDPLRAERARLLGGR